METQRTRTRHASVLAALAVLLTGCTEKSGNPFEVDAQAARVGAPTFAVYTQNLFHGGDTGPILTLDFTNIPAVIQEANVFWNDVQQADFVERAAAIVDEIEARSPHAVALQEAFRVVVLDAAFQPTGGLDMLAVVEAEIAARGLPYVVEVAQSNTNVTLPLSFDPSTGGIGSWLDVTDRIATLRRSDVPLIEVAKGEYQARLSLGPVTLIRGWARVSLEFGGVPHHVVNTHLEIQDLTPVQIGQTVELLDAVVQGLEGVTVIAGDLNSDASGDPSDPKWTPTYGMILNAGFVDLWDAQPPANNGDGLTCCHPKSLTENGPFDQRLDLILARYTGPKAHLWSAMRGQFRAEVVGEETGDQTAGGLWPSDHAGLVGSLKLPQGLVR